MPESNISPQAGIKNLATKYELKQLLNFFQRSSIFHTNNHIFPVNLKKLGFNVNFNVTFNLEFFGECCSTFIDRPGMIEFTEFTVQRPSALLSHLLEDLRIVSQSDGKNI